MKFVILTNAKQRGTVESWRQHVSGKLLRVVGNASIFCRSEADHASPAA